LDRLSTLPDNLLFLILSKISFREVVQCSLLSKIWRLLYREMPNLVLCPYLLTPPRLQPPTPDPHSMSTVENIISNILQSHSSDLMAVRLNIDTAPWNPSPTPVNSIPSQFTRQSVSNWLQCISRKNVKMLILRDSTARESPVPEALFSCNRLTHLKLYNHILTRIPTQFAGFKHLLICEFISIELTDDSLAIFISQCPLLLKLQLQECVGLRRPVISALKITHLNLSVHGVEVLNVKCPKLQKFKNLRQVKELRVNEVSFHELSPAIKTLEMNGGNNLTALWLGLCSREGEYICSDSERFLQIVGSLKSLKALDICSWSLLGMRQRLVAVPILNLLGRLPNLEHFGLRGPSLVLVRKQLSSSY